MDRQQTAQEEAYWWLEWLVNNGRYDWSRFGRLLVKAEPSSNLRCSLLGGAIEIEGGGYEPFFMLGASAKLGSGQWQDATGDSLGVPFPPREALENRGDHWRPGSSGRVLLLSVGGHSAAGVVPAQV